MLVKPIASWSARRRARCHLPSSAPYCHINKLADMFVPEMLDFESAVSKRLMVAFEKDNLCKGWTPRKNERITLLPMSCQQQSRRL